MASPPFVHSLGTRAVNVFWLSVPSHAVLLLGSPPLVHCALAAAVYVLPVAMPSHATCEVASPPFVHEAPVYVPGLASVVHNVPSASAR